MRKIVGILSLALLLILGNMSGVASAKTTEKSTKPKVSAIKVENNKVKSDTITVKGLKKGDIIKVYNSKSKLLYTSTSATKGTLKISVKQLSTGTGQIYVSVTKKGQSESSKTKITYKAEPKVTKGDKGDKGATGSKGDKGDTGAAGATGSKGDKGDTGATGSKGDKGDTGAAGSKGDKGDTGATGSKGDKGDTGATGSKGDKGETGVAGATGSKGDKGETGETGLVGAQGPKGETGETGVAGSKGDKGDTGVAGATGSKGDKGDKGETGETGAQGPAGLAGPIGPAGPQGSPATNDFAYNYTTGAISAGQNAIFSSNTHVSNSGIIFFSFNDGVIHLQSGTYEVHYWVDATSFELNQNSNPIPGTKFAGADGSAFTVLNLSGASNLSLKAIGATNASAGDVTAKILIKKLQ